MDFVFFAFSSLCVGFSVLLAFLLAARQDMQPKSLPYLLSALAGAVYYYLGMTLFVRNLAAYFLANIIPQIIMLILLTLYIWRSRENG